MHLIRLLCPVLLALPLASAAEPVRVTTHMTGQMDPNPFILGQLGFGDYYQHPGGLLPYALTVNSIIDPDARGVSCDGDRCEDFSADISYTFTIDGKTVSFADRDGVAEIRASSSSFQHNIAYLTEELPVTAGNYYIAIDTLLIGPDNSLLANPLAPQEAGGTPAFRGIVSFSALPVDPDNPGYWTMGGMSETARLQVVSVVPEPAGMDMLTSGLALLALAGRRRWMVKLPVRRPLQ